MLEPDGRRLLLDALRPPPGAQLDLAVGTTYSLDLITLLTTPLAFALFDRERDEEGAPDPIAMLESVRRYAERMHIYCQAGLISLPREYQQLLAYVEDRIFEVVPPDRDRIFHPKVWVLRFRDAEGLSYRLICLTRNLTFARAWDTILTLEGRAGEEMLEMNVPLGRFFAALPDLASREPSDEDRQTVRSLANELMHVEFETPEGFDGIDFVSFGLEDGSAFPITDADRMMVISPFLTKGALTRLSSAGKNHVLVSRPESFDAIGRAGLAAFETYVLNEVTQGTEEGARTIPTAEEVGERAQVELDGLHAKLFALDRGDRAHVWTGSANATDAAFNGNVEFLVELTGSRSYAGVTALMRSETGRTNLRDLLERYDPERDEPLVEEVEERLDKRVDQLQRDMAGRAFEARVERLEEEGFAVTLSSDALPALEGVSARCWPISFPATSTEVRGERVSVRFAPLSRQAITAFFALELVARESGVSREVRFVVTAELIGAPSDRRERILADLLDDQAKVLRYLLLLLAEEGMGLQHLGEGNGEMTGAVGPGFGEATLFESMLRALADDPQRLDYIAKLVEDLRTAGREELLPDGFNEVWAPIWAVGQERAK